LYKIYIFTTNVFLCGTNALFILQTTIGPFKCCNKFTTPLPLGVLSVVEKLCWGGILLVEILTAPAPFWNYNICEGPIFKSKAISEFRTIATNAYNNLLIFLRPQARHVHFFSLPYAHQTQHSCRPMFQLVAGTIYAKISKYKTQHVL